MPLHLPKINNSGGKTKSNGSQLVDGKSKVTNRGGNIEGRKGNVGSGEKRGREKREEEKREAGMKCGNWTPMPLTLTLEQGTLRKHFR